MYGFTVREMVTILLHLQQRRSLPWLSFYVCDGRKQVKLVRMPVHTSSTRGRTDSHIKQLSSGGELTTIVWIMAQHAGPYRIGPDRGPLRIGEILARSDDGNFGSDEQSDDDSNSGSDEQPGGDGQQFG
jgi:hypothetical protein